MTTEHPPVAPGTEQDPTAHAAASGTAGGTPFGAADSPYTSRQQSDEHGGTPHGFFAWIRGLGLSRQPGWIGGVCAGIAGRLGIDPIIVRGILIVLALFAPPVLVFYGVAWLLLPDTDGRIHMQRLLRGDPQPALGGIAILIFSGLLLPLSAAAQVLTGLNFFSLAGGGMWGFSASSVIGLLFNLALLGGLGAFVFWLVRRSNKDSWSGGAASASRTASASPTAASGTNGGGIGSGDPDVAATTAAAGVSDVPAAAAPSAATDAAGEPLSPGAGASVDELAAWKLQHEAWRTERERFNREQADANRAARAQWAAENKARSLAFAAQASDYRRARKRERPRASASAVFFTLGLALVVGAGSAIVALTSPANADYAATIGVLVAALVTSVAMIVTGAMRRRSGFLAFITVLLLLVGLGTSLVPRQAQLLWPWAYVDNSQQLGTMTQPWGDLSVWVYNYSNDATAPPRAMTLEKANGSLYINLDRGSSLTLRATVAPGQQVIVNTNSYETGELTQVTDKAINGSGEHSLSLGSFRGGPTADLTLDATLSNGSIIITEYTD
ncbi:PspC domain-containing protein [Microterricola viridarii]|uniref:Phage shock protein PspC N-terminal domain-containing protein n=1 Tax=Microterricola viridarii TaxID=412690 RepID=A0A120I0N4_9MICO|nr:PspC domain-containing protein [Microterricola viridarii]AMB59642.1 hypothetical protein AWU67_13075 [Microterricola viridarii]